MKLHGAVDNAIEIDRVFSEATLDEKIREDFERCARRGAPGDALFRAAAWWLAGPFGPRATIP